MIPCPELGRRRGAAFLARLAALLIVFLSLALAGAAARAQDAPPPSSARDDAYLLRLADHFYASAEYYRAITVYEELLLVTHDERATHHALLRIAMAYHHGLQLAEALAAYDRLLLSPTLPAADALYVRIMRATVRADVDAAGRDSAPLSDLVAELEPLAASPSSAAPLAAFHLARFQLADGHADAARATAARANAQCRARPVDDCAALAELAGPLSWPAPRRRSPALALALSAAVPGLGSLYAGHSIDALNYFGFTVGFGLLAWDVHDGERAFAEQKASFYVLGALASTFYLASLGQAWFGTTRANAVAELEHRQRVLATTDWPLPFEPAPPAPAPRLAVAPPTSTPARSSPRPSAP